MTAPVEPAKSFHGATNDVGYRYVLYVNGIEAGAWFTQIEALTEARKAPDCAWTIWRECWKP